MRQKFSKEERLCSKRSIDFLFNNGSSFVLYPFRIVYLSVPAEELEIKVLISVPKRRFKRAVDRNRIKRLIRETYRLHKYPVLYSTLNTSNKKIHFSIQYIAKEELSFQFLEGKMVRMLNQLKTRCDE